MCLSTMRSKKPSKGKKVKSSTRPGKKTQNIAIPAAFGEATSMKYSKNGAFQVTVQHREPIIGIFQAANNWDPTSYIINPGRSLFPWLSTWANAFDIYRINSLSMDYVPSCSTSTTGTLCMAFDYDPVDPLPASFEAMATNEGSVQTQVYLPATLRYRVPDRVLSQSYVATEGSAEDRFSDAGQFVFGTYGAVDAMIGRLFVNYSITFFRPQLNSTVTAYGAGIPNNINLQDCPGLTASAGRYTDSAGVSILGAAQDVLTQGVSYDAKTGIITVPSDIREMVTEIFGDLTTTDVTKFPTGTGMDPSQNIFKLLPVEKNGSEPVWTVTDVGVLDRTPYGSTNDRTGFVRGLLKNGATRPSAGTLQYRIQCLKTLADTVSHIRPVIEMWTRYGHGSVTVNSGTEAESYRGLRQAGFFSRIPYPSVCTLHTGSF